MKDILNKIKYSNLELTGIQNGSYIPLKYIDKTINVFFYAKK